MSYDFDVRELKRIWSDLEKQVLSFNEIVPYERNPHNIYSPKLVNLMLLSGAQIEAMAKLIVNRLKLNPSGRGIPTYLKEINKNAILSKQRIVSTTSGLLFTPFPAKQEWWNTYNLTKHELKEKMLEIKYQEVMNSLAALAALHHVYDILEKDPTLGKEILDEKNWQNPIQEFFYEDGSKGEKEIEWPNTWSSHLFKITSYFHYVRRPKKIID